MIATKYRAHKDKTSGKEKVVFMLSTCHQPNMEKVDAFHNQQLDVYKPASIKAYNVHMGGVDRVDQQLHNLQCLRKSYKWYRKLALRLIAQMALNAHKVHKKTTGFNLSLLDFVKACIQLLKSSLPALPPNEAGIPDDTHYRLTGQQFPSVKVAREGASNQRPAKACRVCYARGEKQQLKNNLELFSCANIVLVNLDYIPKYVSKSAIPC